MRGCQYKVSVFRELYFQDKANRILSENGLVGANIPLGVWEYAPGQSEEEQKIWTDF